MYSASEQSYSWRVVPDGNGARGLSAVNICETAVSYSDKLPGQATGHDQATIANRQTQKHVSSVSQQGRPPVHCRQISGLGDYHLGVRVSIFWHPRNRRLHPTELPSSCTIASTLRSHCIFLSTLQFKQSSLANTHCPQILEGIEVYKAEGVTSDRSTKISASCIEPQNTSS